MSARPLCGNCAECLARTSRCLAVPPRHGKTRSAMTPTPEALEKHAKRFGPEGVAETAADHGLAVDVERPRRVRKVTGPSLRKRVAGHLEAGHSVELIAELENLSPGRARRLVEELGA